MTKFGDDLIQSMQEALAYARGEEVAGMLVRDVDTDMIDAKAIRQELRLTQEDMALLLGTSVSGYRKWEQKVRQPRGAARTLLQVMAQEPDAVLRALSTDKSSRLRSGRARRTGAGKAA